MIQMPPPPPSPSVPFQCEPTLTAPSLAPFSLFPGASCYFRDVSSAFKENDTTQADEIWFSQFVNSDQCIEYEPVSTSCEPAPHAEVLHDAATAEPRVPNKRRSKQYAKAQLHRLSSWLKQHVQNPYLEPSEKVKLSIETGLTPKQVSSYIANFRRRKLPRQDESHNEEADSFLAPGPGLVEPKPAKSSIHATFGARTEMERSLSLTSATSFSSEPLGVDYHRNCSVRMSKKFADFNGNLTDWYFEQLEASVIEANYSTELENQVQSPSDLIDNVFSSIRCRLSPYAKRDTLLSADGGTRRQSRLGSPARARTSGTASNCSSDTLDYDRRSHYSGRSGNSAGSALSWMSSGSRQGRRTFRVSKQTYEVPISEIPWKCVQCSKRYATRYLMERHASSVHTWENTWLCEQRWQYCPFCDPNVSFCPHRWHDCWNRSDQKRVFSRKDLMKQHLKVFHQTTTDQITEKILEDLRWAPERYRE